MDKGPQSAVSSNLAESHFKFKFKFKFDYRPSTATTKTQIASASTCMHGASKEGLKMVWGYLAVGSYFTWGEYRRAGQQRKTKERKESKRGPKEGPKERRPTTCVSWDMHPARQRGKHDPANPRGRRKTPNGAAGK